jgi:hypothetical protein
MCLRFSKENQMPIQELSCSANHRTDFYLEPKDFHDKELKRFCPMCGQPLTRSVRAPASPLYQPGGMKFVVQPPKTG